MSHSWPGQASRSTRRSPVPHADRRTRSPVTDVLCQRHKPVIGRWAASAGTRRPGQDGRTVHPWTISRGSNSFGADGVIVSTPTGSPLPFSRAVRSWPNIKALQLIRALATFSLFARPLIIGSGSTFTIDILDDSMSEKAGCCDGRRQRLACHPGYARHGADRAIPCASPTSTCRSPTVWSQVPICRGRLARARAGRPRAGRAETQRCAAVASAIRCRNRHLRQGRGSVHLLLAPGRRSHRGSQGEQCSATQRLKCAATTARR